MISVYQDADYLAAYKQKQRLWWTFVLVTALYLGFCIAWLVYYTSLPYADSRGELPKWCVYVVSAVYVVFLFLFMGVKFSRVRNYFKLLGYFSTGLKNDERNYFYCFDETFLQKEHVDAYACVFEIWDKKKREWRERETYFDVEKPLPPFESGDLVRYIAQSNFIVQYETIQKKALEFEEVEEFEEA